MREIIGVYERYHQSVLLEAAQAGLISVRDPAEKGRELFYYIEGLLAAARLHDDVKVLEELPRLGFEFLGINPISRGF